LRLLVAGALGAGGVLAQNPPATTFRPSPHFVTAGKPDPEEGSQALQDFRAAGLSGGYYMEFQLRVMPHKGDERVVHGKIFGKRGEQGPVTRLGISDPSVPGPSVWLIQSGPQPAVWTSATAGAQARQLGAAELFQPVAGTGLTAFDLQMPFLYWSDFVYEGIAKIRGRPSHSILLYPPADQLAQHPELTGVRVALDTQYRALVQAELLGPQGEPTKTITVLDLKKSGDQWLVKSIDLRDSITRDKTRFEVTAAALNLVLPAEMFTPEGLSREFSLPAGATPEKF
jgi:hypothetical protein